MYTRTYVCTYVRTYVRTYVHTYLPYAWSARKIFLHDERRKTMFFFIGSNDARGQCDSFCPKIIKIGAILNAFWPVQSLGFQAKSSGGSGWIHPEGAKSSGLNRSSGLIFQPAKLLGHKAKLLGLKAKLIPDRYLLLELQPVLTCAFIRSSPSDFSKRQFSIM